MNAKSKTAHLVNSFVTLIKIYFSKNVKTIKSANDLKFLLKDFYMQHGIHHQISSVNTPRQKRIVERKNQHLLGVVRALIFQSKVPRIF